VDLVDLVDIPIDRSLNILNMMADEVKGAVADVATTVKKVLKD